MKLFTRLRRLFEAKEGVSFFTASQDDDGFARQIGGGEHVGDVFAGTVVNISAPLLDGASRVALRLVETCLDEGVEDRNFAMIELFARKLGAWNVGENLTEFGV